jgi:uncharacterized protein (DUF1684 family)/glyoxylase-like metal-dependent hydrolase (beta-lactamase superfamily II)
MMKSVAPSRRKNDHASLPQNLRLLLPQLGNSLLAKLLILGILICFSSLLPQSGLASEVATGNESEVATSDETEAATSEGSEAAIADEFAAIQVKTSPLDEHLYLVTGAGGNMAAYTGVGGILLVDADYTAMSEKIKAALAELSDQPVRYVVNTHWHFDHAGGNENFAAWGAQIVAHENVRKLMADAQYLAVIDREVPASPPAALPTITFTDSLIFHFADETITVFHVPHAHTSGDGIVYFHRANTIHVGDNYFNPGYPYIDVGNEGNIDGMISAVEIALQLADDETTIIPGHGPLANRSDLAAYHAMLIGFREAILQAVADGKDLEAILADPPTAELDAQWGGTMFPPAMFTEMVYLSLANQYRPEIDIWHAQRIERLKSDTGWLTLVGLHPLQVGRNLVGSAADCDVRLIAKAPEHLGLLIMSRDNMVFEVMDDNQVRVTGSPEENTSGPYQLKSDADGKPTVLEHGTLSFYAIQRGSGFFLRVKDRESEVLQNFTGIERFPVDPAYRVTAQLVPHDPPRPVRVPDVMGQISESPSPGTLKFQLGGQEYSLTPIGQPGEDLFIVFGDATNGEKTYGGGRFLYADEPGPDGAVILDFNKAYNPPCVFTEYATCPLPPEENVLPLAVEAGEKMWGEQH